MLDILKYTCVHTGKSFKWSHTDIIRYPLVLAGVAVLYLFIEGWDRMTLEIKDILVYGGAFVVLAVVPTFLWNLFMAPSRIVEERLEKKIDEIIDRNAGDIVAPVEEPKHVDVSEYQSHDNLVLYEAACLWVNLEPHHPIRNQKARIKLSQLKSAIRGRKLESQWGSGFTQFIDAINGTRERIPGDKQQVSMTSLRRYAETIHDVPLFLFHIQLPSEPVNDVEDNRRLKPPTPDKSDS